MASCCELPPAPTEEEQERGWGCTFPVHQEPPLSLGTLAGPSAPVPQPSGTVAGVACVLPEWRHGKSFFSLFHPHSSFKPRERTKKVLECREFREGKAGGIMGARFKKSEDLVPGPCTCCRLSCVSLGKASVSLDPSLHLRVGVGPSEHYCLVLQSLEGKVCS